MLESCPTPVPMPRLPRLRQAGSGWNACSSWSCPCAPCAGRSSCRLRLGSLVPTSCDRPEEGARAGYARMGECGRLARGQPPIPCPGSRPMTTPRTTGVWISAASATILRWGPDGVTIRERLDSQVPARHRSTGRPPTEDHPAGEGHRDEHMRAFFAQVTSPCPSRMTCCSWVTARSSSILSTRSTSTTAAAAQSGASRSRRAAP